MGKRRAYKYAGHTFDVRVDLAACKAQMKLEVSDPQAVYECAAIEAMPELCGSPTFKVSYTGEYGGRENGPFIFVGEFGSILQSVAYKLLPPINDTERSCASMAKWMSAGPLAKLEDDVRAHQDAFRSQEDEDEQLAMDEREQAEYEERRRARKQAEKRHELAKKLRKDAAAEWEALNACFYAGLDLCATMIVVLTVREGVKSLYGAIEEAQQRKRANDLSLGR